MSNDKFKILWVNPNSKNYTEIFSYNGKKFRMHFEHTSSYPCGFNSDCCLDLMDSEGIFHHLVDNYEVGEDWERNPYAQDDNVRKKTNDAVAEAFYKYVEAVYGE